MKIGREFAFLAWNRVYLVTPQSSPEFVQGSNVETDSFSAQLRREAVLNVVSKLGDKAFQPSRYDSGRPSRHPIASSPITLTTF
ncbi:MAG TPA: hypothetical protein VHP35_17335 [Terriglobia bacterium]|jgi:hypothetical protein|nr:hypothetical protein [Terriglobia bacterium]